MPDVEPIKSVADAQSHLRRAAADLEAVSAWFAKRKQRTHADRWCLVTASQALSVQEVIGAARWADYDE